ncbi:MAG TPA: hypothetical protein DDX92_00510 [Flavobacteriales bacterium]|nr:hypothetical protein [Flavobacteriales bacterium]
MDDGRFTAITDEEGNYHFPAITSKKKQPGKEPNIFISQMLTTNYKDKELILWNTTKYDFSDMSELGGLPIKLTHELTAKSRNFMIPTFGPYLTNLDGVVDLDHHYVRDLDLGQKKAGSNKKNLKKQLLPLLNTTEMLSALNEKFIHPQLQPHKILEFKKIVEMEIDSFSLYEDASCKEVSLEKNHYAGFTFSGDLLVILSDGQACKVHLYWPKAAIPIIGEAKLVGDLSAITLDHRKILQNGVNAFIQKEKITTLVEQIISHSPTIELAYLIDDRLDLADLIYENKALPDDYKPSYQIEDLEIEKFNTAYVKTEEDYAAVHIEGAFNVAGHPNRYSFRTSLCIPLAALKDASYSVVKNDECGMTFSVSNLAFELKMEHEKLPKKKPLNLHFTVTNLLPKRNIFLIWHTPFEGFGNNFLDITHLDSNTEIPYEGILASRAAPSREHGSYIELEAGESKTSTIDIRQAYTITKKGRYKIVFRPLGGFGQEGFGETEFILI